MALPCRHSAKLGCHLPGRLNGRPAQLQTLRRKHQARARLVRLTAMAKLPLSAPAKREHPAARGEHGGVVLASSRARGCQARGFRRLPRGALHSAARTPATTTA